MSPRGLKAALLRAAGQMRGDRRKAQDQAVHSHSFSLPGRNPALLTSPAGVESPAFYLLGSCPLPASSSSSVAVFLLKTEKVMVVIGL